MPFDPFSGEVFAYTTSVDADGPLVILSKKTQCQLDGRIMQADQNTDQNLLPFNLYPP